MARQPKKYTVNAYINNELAFIIDDPLGEKKITQIMDIDRQNAYADQIAKNISERMSNYYSAHPELLKQY